MPYNVYYLDDEEALCRLFETYINSDLVRVTTFIDADKAIEASRENPPDLFFIDYRLPGLTGDQVANSVPETIPKVLVTGDLSFQPEYNYQHTISKPYSFSEVEALIEKFRTDAI